MPEKSHCLDWLIYGIGFLSFVGAEFIEYVDHHFGFFTVTIAFLTFIMNERRKNKIFNQLKNGKSSRYDDL